MVMYDNEFETKEKKIWTKDKIELQHSQFKPFGKKPFCFGNFHII